MYSCHLFLISSASVRSIPFLSFWVHVCMKCSLGISNFLEEISCLSILFFALIPEEVFVISPCYSLEFCIQMGISFLLSCAFPFSSFHSYLWGLLRQPFCHALFSSVQFLGHVWLFATPWTVASQAPLSTGILQERILEGVAMCSSRGSSKPRDRTQVSHIADGFFTIWTTREVQGYWRG